MKIEEETENKMNSW